VDVNGDGFLDVLSGCYSRMEGGMAGLFYVLAGRQDRTFAAPKVLTGTDGNPLLLDAAGRQDDTDRICTRPTAVDLDDDGKLDLVAGNFRGTFGLFRGEGGGRFQPKNTWLEDGSSKLLTAGAHGDPFFADWDGDGDLDLLAGSSSGGVYYFENAGSKKAPSFKKSVELVSPPKGNRFERVYGDAHVKGPQSGTRVYVDDVDGDGKLDLLIGDDLTLYYLGEGVTPKDAEAKYAEWEKKVEKLSETLGSDPKKRDQFTAAYKKLIEERNVFLREDSTGFVWLYRRK
jgi:hypothetical protein